MFRSSHEGPTEEKAPTGQSAHRVHGGRAMKSLTKKMRLVSVGVAAGLTLGLVGTAAAVTSSSSTVRSSPAAPYIACANRQRVLKIMPNRTCPVGTFEVTVGARAQLAREARGVQLARGVRLARRGQPARRVLPVPWVLPVLPVRASLSGTRAEQRSRRVRTASRSRSPHSRVAQITTA